MEDNEKNKCIIFSDYSETTFVVGHDYVDNLDNLKLLKKYD
jgi:hypothetical protein